jgi:phosphoribosylglycinamide formyltransferase-1
MKRRALGVLASGRGSNLEAILAARARGELPIPLRVVISDNPAARALEVARAAGVPAVHLPPGPSRSRLTPEAEIELVRILGEHGVDLVALAGFMRILHDTFLSAFPEAVLNIHPSLLPAFPGLRAQEQALQWGVRWAGCTVHFVTAGVDAGPIISQAVVPVEPGDTEDTLAARILVEEHRLYPEAIARVARGGYRIEGRRVILLDAPVEATGIPAAATRPRPAPGPSRDVEGEKA